MLYIYVALVLFFVHFLGALHHTQNSLFISFITSTQNRIWKLPLSGYRAYEFASSVPATVAAEQAMVKVEVEAEAEEEEEGREMAAATTASRVSL